MNNIIGTILASSLILAGQNALAEVRQEQVMNEREALSYEADSSGKNVRDRTEVHKTADDQSIARRDTEILAKIRQEIVANDKLSTNGKNIKILVENDRVTLRGPVKSIDEKSWIERAATQVATAYRIDNQLEVVPR